MNFNDFILFYVVYFTVFAKNLNNIFAKTTKSSLFLLFCLRILAIWGAVGVCIRSVWVFLIEFHNNCFWLRIFTNSQFEFFSFGNLILLWMLSVNSVFLTVLQKVIFLKTSETHAFLHFFFSFSFSFLLNLLVIPFFTHFSTPRSLN